MVEISLTLGCSVKQTQDDEKSVERAHRELVKLDQQLGVSMAQFTEVWVYIYMYLLLFNDDVILCTKRFVIATLMHLRSSSRSRPRLVTLSTHSRQAFKDFSSKSKSR